MRLAALAIPYGPAGADVQALGPQALVDAGFLANPEAPAGALRKGRALVRHGRYQEARALLAPHARCADPTLGAEITELLGVAAIHLGGDWRQLLGGALAVFAKVGDAAGQARCHRQLGEASLMAGEFEEAATELRRAAALCRAGGDTAGAAMADAVRARATLRAGHIEVALGQIDRALAELLPLGRAREEGMARLDRARILAFLGDATTSAKELISAERMLAGGGSQSDRLWARLTRAEALLILGDTARAGAGLRRLLIEAVDTEELPTRAWLFTLLGRAVAAESPSEGRRHLMRGKHLYQQAGSTWGAAHCELALARVEHRLGFAVAGRLSALGSMPLSEWPMFAAELRTVRGEVTAERDPELARRLLLDARRFAVSSGNRSLARGIDRTLRRAELVAGDDLMPMENERTLPMVHGGVTVSAGWVPPGGPQAIDDDVVTEQDQVRAMRLIQHSVRLAMLSGLTPPEAVGVRR